MKPVASQHLRVSSRPVALLVWGTWALMTLAALVQLIRYGHNVPFAEDWTVVPFAHGREPISLSWLWSQNNEHRVPLPRLLLVALFRWTSDYRAGMFFNLAALA